MGVFFFLCITTGLAYKDPRSFFARLQPHAEQGAVVLLAEVAGFGFHVGVFYWEKSRRAEQWLCMRWADRRQQLSG
jgi:hypothetical protein